jgi:hypothetical protein
MGHERQPGKAPSRAPYKSAAVVWCVAAILTLLAVAFLVTHSSQRKEVTQATLPSVTYDRSPQAGTSSQPGSARLTGRWLRPDGGYVIDIRNAQADGRLEASYFNPRPIHVSRAEWSAETNGLRVFVELRDQNYPGATYKLKYDADVDRLVGEYYQPIYQQTFEVAFVRIPNQP